MHDAVAFLLSPKIMAATYCSLNWSQQGQEYAALGALVSDDEPLSSPPGATEMELKVKQVC